MKLFDQHHRIHDYLRISLTERCNLRCFYCMPEEGIKLRPKADFMSLHEVLAISEIFVAMGVRKIRLTGGEPLVRKDTHEIIKGLATLPVELAITTNGILVDEYIDTFTSYGLKSVNVSLDTLKIDRFEKITRRNYFQRIINNIKLLIHHNFHVKINVVVIKGVNDDEICDFISLTRDLNIHVRFIEFMPFNGNRWLANKVVSYIEIMDRVSLDFSGDIIKLDDIIHDTAKNYAIRNHVGTFAIISSVTNPFCDACNRIRLTADGKLKNCLFSNTETDLLSSLRNGYDIKKLISGAIWDKKAIRGGMDSNEKLGNQNNRAMVAIGG